jgi:gluconokinase
MMQKFPPAVVVMGVAGCGKTSIAQEIVTRVGGRLIEGDAFHPAENIAKMRAGVPLDDTDRHGWLAQLGAELAAAVAAGERPVLACSALKRRYRDQLRDAVPDLGFVFLDLPRAAAAERVATRPGHFMPVTLVESQFADLERPDGEAGVLCIDATLPLATITAEVMRQWSDPTTEARC